MSFGWAFLSSTLSGTTNSILKKTGDFTFEGISSFVHNTEESRVERTGGFLVNDGTFKVTNGQMVAQMYGVTTEGDGAQAINLSNGNNQIIFLGHNITMSNPTNAEDGGVYNFFLLQDVTGGREVSFGSNYYFPDGIKPALSTGAEDVDFITCRYVADVDGGRFLCNGAANYVQGSVTSRFGDEKYRQVSTSETTATTSDRIIGIKTATIAAASTVNLPSATTVPSGFYVLVKDVDGSAGTYNISVLPSGSEEIDGDVEFNITTNYAAASFFSDGSNWFVY